MCVGHHPFSACRIDPNECARSQQRMLRNQVFHDLRRLSDPMGHTLKTATPPPTDESEEVKRFVLKVKYASSSSPCIICKLVERICSKMGSQADLRDHFIYAATETPEFQMLVCGHVFHESCLFSYLTENSALNSIKCTRCEITRVHVKGADVRCIEEGMEEAKRNALE